MPYRGLTVINATRTIVECIELSGRTLLLEQSSHPWTRRYAGLMRMSTPLAALVTSKDAVRSHFYNNRSLLLYIRQRQRQGRNVKSGFKVPKVREKSQLSCVCGCTW